MIRAGNARCWMFALALALAGVGCDRTPRNPASAPPAPTNASAKGEGKAANPGAEADALVVEADRLTGAGDWAGAATVYERAVKMRPEEEELRFNLAYAYMQLKRTNDAIAQYRECVRILPEYGEAHNNLGNILRKKGDFPGAIEEFQLAIRHSPSNSNAHNNLGTALALQGKLPEAVPYFVRATQLNPNYAEAWGNLGTAYVQEGRARDGIAPLRRALALNPQLETARRALAKAERQLSGKP